MSRNSLLFIIRLIASLSCTGRPTPCRRRGRIRTGIKIPALLKRQAARRRAMRHSQFRELAVQSLSLIPPHTGSAVPLRFLVKTAITAVTPPVSFHSFSPTRHTCLPR